MANELVHGSVGTELTQAEWEGVGTHVFNSQATGDIVYASSSTQLSRLAKGTDTHVLILSSGIPAWSTSTGITALGTIATGVWEGTDVEVAYGGTGVSTLTDGGILLGSGASAITAMAVLTDGQMIVGDGTTDPVAESGATLRTSIGVGTGDSPSFTALTLDGDLGFTGPQQITTSSGDLTLNPADQTLITLTDDIDSSVRFRNSAATYYNISTQNTAAVNVHQWDSEPPTVASAGGNTYILGSFNAYTLTYTGTTQMTVLQPHVRILSHTIAGDTATLTVDKATSLQIVAPIEGSNVTLVDASAIRILNPASGTPTNQYGIKFDAALTGGTSLNVGIDMGTNSIENVGASGNDWTATAFTHDGAATFNDSGADYDFRIESADNANMLVIDGADNNMGLGAGKNDDIALTIGFPTYVAGANQNAFWAYLTPAITEAGSGTHGAMIGVHVAALVNTNAGGATTDAATFRIAGAPTGATPTGGNYAFWVDAGTSRFDGAVEGVSDYQEFTSSGTWTKPNTGTIVTVEVIGAGAGGGGGQGGAVDSIRSNGNGGGGAARVVMQFDIDDLGSTETVTIGAAGTAGAAGSSADGSIGGVGGDSSFGSRTVGYGGYAGDTSSTGGDGAGWNDTDVGSPHGLGMQGGNGQNNNPGGNSEQGGGGGGGSGSNENARGGGSSTLGSGGGGAGGSVYNNNAVFTASAAGVSGVHTPTQEGGGAAAGAPGVAGAAVIGRGAGGGGGGNGNASGTGYAGGAGGAPGGGGGGGGGGTTVGGVGGLGGRGEVRVWTR